MADALINRLRADTPHIDHHVHLNHAGASLPPACVVDAQVAHLRLEAEQGGYAAARMAAPKVQATRQAAARLIGAQEDELAIMISATDAWRTAFWGLVGDLPANSRVLVGRAAYGTNVISLLQAAKRLGLTVELIDDDDAGQVDLDDLRRRINGARLVCLTHIPTGGGLVNPAEAVGELCAEAGVPYLLDACQSAGQLPLDVARLHCTALAATGRKYLRGPRGTGFLYVRADAQDTFEPPMLDLTSATWTDDRSYTVAPGARRYESFEKPVAAVAGLGVAIDYALQHGIDALWPRIQRHAATLRAGLDDLAGVTVHDRGEVLCGIVTLSVANKSAQQVCQELDQQGIRGSVTHRSSSRWQLEATGEPAVVRLSAHALQTEDELQQAILAVAATRPSSTGHPGV